jgi:hypothetical protein
MKALSIVVIPFMLFAAIFQTQVTEKKASYYYFCTSRAKMPDMIKGKETILFTDIKTMADKAEIADKTATWNDKVSGICANDMGCTAELRYFPTMEEAKTALDQAKLNYSDATKYIVQDVITR